ncbi:MAG: hypothetical protein JSU73_12280, partial [candidate division WOR-3 bacterium]
VWRDPPVAVEDQVSSPKAEIHLPTVMSRARLLAELHQDPSLSLFDATGRRILDLQPSSGVVFVGSAGTVNKVLLTD